MRRAFAELSELHKKILDKVTISSDLRLSELLFVVFHGSDAAHSAEILAATTETSRQHAKASSGNAVALLVGGTVGCESERTAP